MFYIDIWEGRIAEWIPLWGGEYMALWPVFNIADASIFIGVATILIAVGLTKKHHIARIGAYIVFIISGLNIAFLLYIGLRPNEDGQVGSFGLLEYMCVVYILLALVAIFFLSIPSTRRVFARNNELT